MDLRYCCRMSQSSTAIRAMFRKKLDKKLGYASDENLLEFIWAVNTLQSGNEAQAAAYFDHGYPREAATSDMTSKLAIYKWELETLANEVLVVPKSREFESGARILNTRMFETARQMVRILRQLENAESARALKDNRILREMVRIANRQFDWQRGYNNVVQFYRNAFVYGQGACADYFEERHGITLNDFSFVGFALFSQFALKPVLASDIDGTPIGLDRKRLEIALGVLARPIDEMKRLARTERHGIYETAYRPSVLRQHPCIAFGAAGERIRTPLPQLIIDRVTSGVFYDVIGGSGAVRADYGRRFEEYAISYLRAQLPEADWQPEHKYRLGKDTVDSPDILLMDKGAVSVAIECKATRMGYGARFGSVEIDERGFEDLIKAVFQLWRFFSHCRRCLSGVAVGADAVGAVLTLDGWLTMANLLEAEVLEAAEEMAARRDPQILEEDRRPIAFFPVTDMEATLMHATPASFVSAIRRRTDLDRRGYMLVTVHDEFEEPGQPEKPFPFGDDVGRLLPWWDVVDEEKRKRAGRPA